MNHEIYLFGSICRGEQSTTSDVDVLVLPFSEDRSNYPAAWSVYSPELIREYFSSGRLFAWHLYLESKCVYSTNDCPFLETLGSPAPYSTMNKDIDELEVLLQDAINELRNGTKSVIYEMGIVYTAIRDIAMSASWVLLDVPNFSSDVPYKLPIYFPLDFDTYHMAKLARHSSTRGIQINTDIDSAVDKIIHTKFSQWIDSLRGDNEKYFSQQSIG